MLLGIPFTVGQVVLYAALNWPDVLRFEGVVDEVRQVALFAVLVALYRRGP